MTRDVPQAAALPVRGGRVCLVTSRSGRRWVLPKGTIDPGHTAAATAAREAWEEAGLTGHLAPAPAGRYRYGKRGGTFAVAVFPLSVTGAAADWPERRGRRREWVAPAEAARRVAEPELRAIILAVTGAIPD